jgi:pimeloyl-ACP methyl ester carboxylesterase
MILLHPTGTSARQMAALAGALSPSGASCIDRPGWGQEAPPPPSDRAGFYRAQGAWLAASVGGGRPPVDLFGWSSGGLVALHAALVAPSAFGTLYLYEPPLWSSRDHGDRAQLFRFATTLLWGALRAERRAAASFWRMVTPRRTGPSGFDRLAPSQRAELLAVRGPLVRELLAGTGEELAGTLGQLAPRVVVLVGGDSGPGARRAAERLAGASPRAEVRVLEGLDHLGPLVSPAAVAGALG